MVVDGRQLRGVTHSRSVAGHIRAARTGDPTVRVRAMQAMKTKRGDGRRVWKPPTRARVLRMRERLREVYGVPLMKPHGHPIAELVLTVLSQSTNDRNRDVAYLRLRERFGSWEAVMRAPVGEVEEAIRPGGISKVKSARIKAILQAIAADPRDPDHELSLDWLPDAPIERGARLPHCPAGRGAQDGGVRAAVRLRDARRAGGHARLARGHAPGATEPGRAVRAAARSDARADPTGRGAGAAREPVAPRAADVPARRPACGECALARMCPSRGMFV